MKKIMRIIYASMVIASVIYVLSGCNILDILKREKRTNATSTEDVLNAEHKLTENEYLEIQERITDLEMKVKLLETVKPTEKETTKSSEESNEYTSRFAKEVKEEEEKEFDLTNYIKELKADDEDMYSENASKEELSTRKKNNSLKKDVIEYTYKDIEEYSKPQTNKEKENIVSAMWKGIPTNLYDPDYTLYDCEVSFVGDERDYSDEAIELANSVAYEKRTNNYSWVIQLNPSKVFKGLDIKDECNQIIIEIIYQK